MLVINLTNLYSNKKFAVLITTSVTVHIPILSDTTGKLKLALHNNLISRLCRLYRTDLIQCNFLTFHLATVYLINF